jgi:hypothetical protein
MGQSGWIEGVRSSVYKALESSEEIHNSIAHEFCDDGIDFRISWKYQA